MHEDAAVDIIFLIAENNPCMHRPVSSRSRRRHNNNEQYYTDMSRRLYLLDRSKAKRGYIQVDMTIINTYADNNAKEILHQRRLDGDICMHLRSIKLVGRTE